MIRPEELRIGNWVFIQGEGHYQWECGDFDLLTDEFPLHPDPIPLSSDILIACGFKDVSHDYSTGYDFLNVDKIYGIGYFFVSIKNGVFNKYWYNDSDAYYSWIGQEIKSLHSLMNLFYALTGEEITYKPINN